MRNKLHVKTDKISLRKRYDDVKKIQPNTPQHFMLPKSRFSSGQFATFNKCRPVM